jgi:hypothetical protein
MLLDADTPSMRAGATIALSWGKSPARLCVVALFAASLWASTRPAAADTDGFWANETIQKMMSEPDEDEGVVRRRRRVSAVERMDGPLVDEDATAATAPAQAVGATQPGARRAWRAWARRLRPRLLRLQCRRPHPPGSPPSTVRLLPRQARWSQALARRLRRPHPPSSRA